MDLPRALERLDANGQCFAYLGAQSPQRIPALVEIVTGTGGVCFLDKLHGLYRASQGGLIILALQGVAAGAIDQILDDVVPSLPLRIPGILYLDAQDEAAVVPAARAAGLIIVATRRFGAMIEANGIDRRLIVNAFDTHASGHANAPAPRLLVDRFGPAWRECAATLEQGRVSNDAQ